MIDKSIALRDESSAFGSGVLKALDELDIDVVQEDVASSPDVTGTPFIAFDHKTGIYSVGKQRTTLPDKQRIVLNPGTARKGFMAFIKGQKLPEKKMAPFYSREAITTDDLPNIDSKYGWRPAGSIYGTLIGGPRSGLDVALEGMGTHFKMAFDDLFRGNRTNPKGIGAALVENRSLPPEEREIFPLVELTFRTYVPSGETEQKIAHQFVIVNWLTANGVKETLREALQSAADDVLEQASADAWFTEEELEASSPARDVEAEVEAVDEPIRRKPRRK